MLCAVAALAFISCENPEDPQDGNKPDNDNPPVEAVDGIFVYGAATSTGFSLEDMESFEEVGGLYSWEGYLIAGSPFQFPTQKTSEWPCWMISVDEEGSSPWYMVNLRMTLWFILLILTEHMRS